MSLSDTPFLMAQDTLLRCSWCELLLEPEAFHLHSKNSRGRQHVCKECTSTKARPVQGPVDLAAFFQCSKCHETKSAGEFVRTAASNKRPVAYACRACDAAYRDQNRESVRRASRRRALKKRYGMTLEDESAMRDAQGNRCAICKSHAPICVDHDHATGKVRALLCVPCNAALGCMKDEPARLRAAADYLEEHSVSV